MINLSILVTKCTRRIYIQKVQHCFCFLNLIFILGYLQLLEEHAERKGLCCTLVLQCTVCKKENSFPSSPNAVAGRGGGGAGGYSAEINRRSVLAAREVGLGREALADICGYMDLPPPIESKSFQDHTKQIHGGTDEASVKSIFLVHVNE